MDSPLDLFNATLRASGVCEHCSRPGKLVVHSGACPRVKSIEYHPSGAIKRVEFWPERVEAIGKPLPGYPASPNQCQQT